MTNISNTQDIIDSRDIVARITEIEDELSGNETDDKMDNNELREELIILNKLVDEINSYAGDTAEDGVTLILDTYFDNYAQQLAEDIGAINKDAKWPNNHIDWMSAAEELKQDYSQIDYDGSSYWIR